MQTKALKNYYQLGYNEHNKHEVYNMDVLEFAKAIGIDEVDASTILPYKIKPFKYKYYCYLLEKAPSRFLKIVKRNRGFRGVFLEFFLRHASQNSDKYIDFFHGDIDAYFRQFRDITIWLNDCKTKFGEVGIDEANWVINSHTLYIVRLGRLQYERRPYVHKGTLEIENYHKALHTIHIPSDGKLIIEEVIDSLKQAQQHFNQDVFFCRTWLLSPEVNALLSDGSNIKKFSSLFTPMGAVPSRQAEQFVFGKVLDDYTKYAEDTSLKRAIKKALIDGTVLTEGFGIIDLKKI